jgi:glucose/arabinose dehydrogenase
LVHLIRYDPDKNQLEDCGMIRAKMPKTWIVHQADALITGADGELYIGESDAISRLIACYPPVEKRLKR